MHASCASFDACDGGHPCHRHLYEGYSCACCFGSVREEAANGSAGCVFFPYVGVFNVGIR